MNQVITNMNKRMIYLVALVVACFALAPATVKAHGDLIHVIGTVVKVSDTGVSVKTRDGKIVEVQFGDKTTYTRGKAAMEKSGIKVGERIVIHAAKVNDQLVAHTVEMGMAPAAKS